jgi:serine/threonine-protein kinase
LTGDGNAIYAGDLDGAQPKLLLRANSQAIFMRAAKPEDPGKLLFMRDGTLMAQPFDPKTQSLDGDPSPVVERVWSYLTYGGFSASDTGTLAYRLGTLQQSRLTWVDRAGKRLGEAGPAGRYWDVELSPDGKTVAVVRAEGGANRNIWLLDLARDVPARFTFEEGSDNAPTWSADGNRVYYSAARKGAVRVYQADIGGRGEEVPLVGEGPTNALDVADDGSYLLYSLVDQGRGRNRDLWLYSLTGEKKARPFLTSPFNEIEAQFSPGRGPQPRWVAYASDESGQYQIYIRPLEGGRPYQVSTKGGAQPRWSRDGKELFYVGGGWMMAVDVQLGPSPTLGNPKALFAVDLPQVANGNLKRYDVAPDGKRFLINMPQEEGGPPAPVTVVLNWRGKP